MNNGRINNSQRKVFAKLAEETLLKKIEEARDEAGELVAEITEQVKRELGVDTIDNQISTLQEKKKALGFPEYSHQSIRKGSEAGKLIDSRTHTQGKKICDLEEKHTEVIAKIWASISLDEAMGLLNEVRAL